MYTPARNIGQYGTDHVVFYTIVMLLQLTYIGILYNSSTWFWYFLYLFHLYPTHLTLYIGISVYFDERSYAPVTDIHAGITA